MSAHKLAHKHGGDSDLMERIQVADTTAFVGRHEGNQSSAPSTVTIAAAAPAMLVADTARNVNTSLGIMAVKDALESVNTRANEPPIPVSRVDNSDGGLLCNLRHT